MSLSKVIVQQIERLEKMGSFSLNQNQKQELALFNEQNGLKLLVNFGCRTCVRDSLYSAGRFLKQKTDKPKLYKGAMVKHPKDMKRPELMRACKDKNIKFGRSATKKELIKLLENV